MRGRAAMVMAVLVALALPSAASAGGFATVGLGSLPDGTAPGTPWHLTLTILQHGRTPLPNLRPTVTVTSADGATARTFAARPGRTDGVYTADVVFPTAGVWRYEVNDNFSQVHRFAPVAIGAGAAIAPPPPSAGAAGSSGGANVGAALGAAAIAGVLTALLAAALMRRRRPAPAAVAAR